MGSQPSPKEVAIFRARLGEHLHQDVRVAGAVLQILLRAIRTTLRRASPGAPPDAQLGAVSFFHRFGSSLNVHPHYHLVVLDGVFSKADDSEIGFHEAHDLTPDLSVSLAARGTAVFPPISSPHAGTILSHPPVEPYHRPTD
jgi:hypothetical protein